MRIRPISDWTLYKHRFILAYAGLGIILIALLFSFLGQMPPGLSVSEQQSVVASYNLSFSSLPTPQQIINLPYHALQKLSVYFLGVTPLGVRLPSLILAFFAALYLSLIIKRWFKVNIAIVSSLIIITSCWFLSLARLGTPDIMIPFWTCLLILAATYVSQQTQRWELWKAAFILGAALSLYTPYMSYLFVAAVIATLAQPHLRYLIKQSSKFGVTLGTFFFAVLLVPLAWGVYNSPALLRDIFAIPSNIPDPLEFGQNLLLALSNLANPYNLATTDFVMPLLGVSATILILFGLYRLLSDFHSVRTYVLLIWIAILLPIIGFHPNNLTVLFVPSMLIMAIGLNLVVRYWYKMFPINPYARFFGIIPLFILVVAMVHFDHQRYTYNMLYDPTIGQTFSPDAFLLQDEVNSLPAGETVTIVAPEEDISLYQIIADRRPEAQVLAASQAAMAGGYYVVAESENSAVNFGTATPSALIVDDRKDSSLRFRVYQ